MDHRAIATSTRSMSDPWRPVTWLRRLTTCLLTQRRSLSFSMPVHPARAAPPTLPPCSKSVAPDGHPTSPLAGSAVRLHRAPRALYFGPIMTIPSARRAPIRRFSQPYILGKILEKHSVASPRDLIGQMPDQLHKKWILYLRRPDQAALEERRERHSYSRQRSGDRR
jgi:hypothetical protein